MLSLRIQLLMRKLFLYLILLASCSGKLKNGANDTIFLLKVNTKDYSQIVYIERNRQSADYKFLLNFSFDSAANADFKESNSYLKQKHHRPFKKYDLAGLPKEWLPVYRYKGKYYLYSPSEGGNEDRRIFTDSTIIYWGMEGPIAAPFQAVKKLNTGTWFFKQTKFIIAYQQILLLYILLTRRVKLLSGSNRQYQKNTVMVYTSPKKMPGN